MLRSRYRRIVVFFGRILLSLLFWDVFLPRMGFRGRSNKTRSRRLKKYAASFRTLAVSMGGVMIKVGQFLSTRVDVLPPEFTDELQGLQDEVPAESFEAIRQAAESEFGVHLAEKYAAFEQTPLAAASLGQVHRARLLKPPVPDLQPNSETGYTNNYRGIDVVVKILRPNIEQIINTDLAALGTVGKWLHRYRPIRRRANVPALLREFTKILHEEIDYLAEGRNAETFAANFRGHPGVRVPHVVWSHTTRRVLTLENVFSIKITDYEAIEAAGLSRADVAGRLLDTYLQQIFEDGFFHADPHPGNLFVDPLLSGSSTTEMGVARWELTFVDFGMVGHVPEKLRIGLREMLVGVASRDADRVVESFQTMDLLLPSADLTLLAKAIEREFDLFWGKNMTEMTSIGMDEVQEFTEEFRDLLYEMPFQVPQDVLFLARCVGILSGICTGLDPEFNIWEHMAPFSQKLVAQEAQRTPEMLLSEVEKFARTLWVLPSRVDRVLNRLDRGDVVMRTPELSRQMQRLDRGNRRLTGGVIFAALLLGGIQLYLAGETTFSVILFSGALIDFLWILFGRRSAADE